MKTAVKSNPPSSKMLRGRLQKQPKVKSGLQKLSGLYKVDKIGNVKMTQGAKALEPTAYMRAPKGIMKVLRTLTRVFKKI